MLTGQAKRDYQREYMRNYRKNSHSAISGQKQGLENVSGLSVSDERQAVRPVRPPVLDLVRPTLDPVNVRPKPLDLVRPTNISDSQWNYIKFKAEQNGS